MRYKRPNYDDFYCEEDYIAAEQAYEDAEEARIDEGQEEHYKEKYNF